MTVHWDGAVNARVIAGDFYRMGRREWLSSQGWRQAHGDGVRTVVDLRSPGEVGRRATDPVVTGVPGDVAIMELPVEDFSNPEYATLCQPYMNHPEYYADVLRLFPKHVSGVFSALASAQGAVVLHCSAGRDRTGLVATMLLCLAGRSGEALEQDRLAVEGINSWHLVSPTKHPHESHMDAVQLKATVADRAAALATFVHGLDVHAFLLDNGVTETEIAEIVRRCS